MPSPSPALDLWSEERTPTWLVLAPLLLVVATLAALVVVPHLVTQRNAALRQELSDVLSPLAAYHAELERSVAAEAAAVRGYALTGDIAFADRFLNVHAYAEQVAAAVDSVAAVAGGDVAAAAAAFQGERVAWESLNLGRTPSELREGLGEHQRQFEAVNAAARRFDEVIDGEIAAHRSRIEAAYDLRSRVTAALALVALLAGAAALWLAYRLRKHSRHLLRRARDEAALRRIAQCMTEATDLADALGLIAEALASTARADGVRIEQVAPDSRDVQVVGSAGEALEEVRGGSRLLVPLTADGAPLGSAVLGRGTGRPPFDEAEAHRARLLADMAALVLQRMGHFDEVRRKERALEETAAELRGLTESLEAQVQERTRHVHHLARELTLAEQRERRALAQILHDELQQALFGLQLHLRLLETRHATLDEAALGEAFGTLHALVSDAILSTRGLTVDLSPPILPEEGLVDALRWLAEHMEQRFGLRVEVRAARHVAAPSEEMHSLLFQTTREFLFNVVKHAGVDRAFVRLYEEDGHVVVEVRDEGAGFAPSEEAGPLGGFGLRRARERLRLFGGRAEVCPGEGGGTRATVSLPVR